MLLLGSKIGRAIVNTRWDNPLESKRVKCLDNSFALSFSLCLYPHNDQFKNWKCHEKYPVIATVRSNPCATVCP